MLLKGTKIVLRPMRPNEIELFYKWATNSDNALFWYGEKSGDPIPTMKGFLKDWKQHYFDGSAPEKGRSFVIMLGRRRIGQINYNKIIKKDNSVELDIIIAQERDTGKGYGSDAIKTLMQYLFGEMGVKKCWIAPDAKNLRAIRAYEKCGFKKVKRLIDKNGRPSWRMECINKNGQKKSGKLVLPSQKYKDSYLEAQQECKQSKLDLMEHRQLREGEPFSKFVRRVRGYGAGKDLPKGFVPETVLWLVDKSQFIGGVSIRHKFNKKLRTIGGHIGYWIRPSKWQQGYGTKILALALPRARQLGIKKVLVTCDENNLGSRRIIEKNGGILENIVSAGAGKPKKLRFWIDLTIKYF